MPPRKTNSSGTAPVVVTTSVARSAVQAVMAKHGGKPIDADAWLRTLTPTRRAALEKRYLGPFGPTDALGVTITTARPMTKKAAPPKYKLKLAKKGAAKKKRSAARKRAG